MTTTYQLPMTLDPPESEDADQHAIEPPTACANCGGLMFWWDAKRGIHCLECDPPVASRRLMQAREKILARVNQ